MIEFILLTAMMIYYQGRVVSSLHKLNISSMVSAEIRTIKVLLSFFSLSYLARTCYGLSNQLFFVYAKNHKLNVCVAQYWWSCMTYSYLFLLPVFDILPILAIAYYHSKNFRISEREEIELQLPLDPICDLMESQREILDSLVSTESDMLGPMSLNSSKNMLGSIPHTYPTDLDSIKLAASI